MMLLILLLIVIAVLPVWPYSSGWGAGYYPSGVGLILLIILALYFTGHLGSIGHRW